MCGVEGWDPATLEKRCRKLSYLALKLIYFNLHKSLKSAYLEDPQWYPSVYWPSAAAFDAKWKAFRKNDAMGVVSIDKTTREGGLLCLPKPPPATYLAGFRLDFTPGSVELISVFLLVPFALQAERDISSILSSSNMLPLDRDIGMER